MLQENSSGSSKVPRDHITSGASFAVRATLLLHQIQREFQWHKLHIPSFMYNIPRVRSTALSHQAFKRSKTACLASPLAEVFYAAHAASNTKLHVARCINNNRLTFGILLKI